MKASILSYILLLFWSAAVAQDIIKVEDNLYQNLGKKIGFVEDTLKNFNFQQVESMPNAVFQASKNDVFNGGTVGKVWWMKLKYTCNPDTKVYLVLDYGNIDHIDIYYRDNQNRIGHIKSGTFSDSSSRTFVASEYIFQLPEDIRGDIKDVYVRLHTVNTLLAPVKLVDGMVLAKALHVKYAWQIIYLGASISLFLFNLLMLILTRDRQYALYIIRIFTLFYAYVLLYLNGYAHFFSDAASQFILVHAHTFIAVGFIATIYFNNQFLNLKKHLPKSIPFFNFLVFMWICLLVVSLWDTRSLTNRAAQILVFVNSIAVLYVSLRIGKKLRETKNPFVLCYIIGWMPICLTTIYVVFTLIEVLPFEDFTLKLLTGAGILEATLISLALLGDRFRLLRKDKEKAEQMSIQLVKERNIFLEQKIDERTKELQVANDKLKESNEFKDKLFSIIAHDMRTPLSSLKGVLQLVEENVLDAEQLNDFLVQIRKNTEQVQQTMDNLLNWAISQMNMQRYEPESINLKAFVCEHLAIYEHLAKNKEITTYIDCPNEIIVYADKNQLSLIVRNLIDNAIKFTLLKGTIHIDLKIINNRAHFCISNTGKPLSAQAIAKILDAETLTTSYGTAEEKGTGLGLQLCKEFIKNMNSSLKIESSDLENGTNIKFSFEIPLQ